MTLDADNAVMEDRSTVIVQCPNDHPEGESCQRCDSNGEIRFGSLALWEDEGKIKRFSDELKGPKRLQDESYEEYRARLKREKYMLKYYRKGRAL